MARFDGRVVLARRAAQQSEVRVAAERHVVAHGEREGRLLALRDAGVDAVNVPDGPRAQS